MRQHGAGGRDAAICEREVGTAQRRGDVKDEEPVEEAYRRVPGGLAWGEGWGGGAHRRAGRRPKKATKVKNDTVRARTIRVRASAMVPYYNTCIVWWWC
jgi:hypothetical protein